jgi:hypothetical protein
MMPEKLSVYVRPCTTVVVLLLKVKIAPVADRFDHWFIRVPLLSRSVTVTLLIWVVPEAPVIVKAQVALLPEKDKVKLCLFAENGSIATNADALTDKHRIEMQSNNSLKVLFIRLPSVIKY